ncbi:uncharacterized protein [Montipora foliosa]|uniref:uncharacterized protein n=1 Tax=Montipora foliosa TaxID=591990 RepID=UPI0035F168A6
MSNRDVRAPSPQLLVEVTPLNQHGSIENSGRNEVLDCENESGPTEVVEKRTAFVFKALQCVGLIGGERSRKFALLVSVTMWLPPISLAVCVSKNPIMSSPSGLPTVLLFSGLALSHHFGALYGFRNQERLRRNIYLAFQRANFFRTCVIVTVVFGILTLPYLALLVYLYVMQPIRPVPWLQITVVYFFGYIYCALASVGINLAFSTACSVIKIRINDFKRKFQTWSEGLSEALTEYQELCDFMQEEIDAIKWWLLVNVICFFVLWLVNFHLWQILASREGEADIVRLVFYNCSWSNPLPAPELWLPGRLITVCEILFSSLVFFFFMSPLFWAAMVTVHCNRFREWVNRTQVRTDERPLGNFSVTSLDFFINRVQMATYFAFRLFGINVTKVLISVTGFMTTVQFVLTIATKKLFAS